MPNRFQPLIHHLPSFSIHPILTKGKISGHGTMSGNAVWVVHEEIRYFSASIPQIHTARGLSTAVSR